VWADRQDGAPSGACAYGVGEGVAAPELASENVTRVESSHGIFLLFAVIYAIIVNVNAT